MSPADRCTCLLILAAVSAMSAFPRSWFGYPWNAGPVQLALEAVGYLPLVAWAILGKSGNVLRIVIGVCLLVGCYKVGRIFNSNLEIAILTVLVLGVARLFGGVHLTHAPSMMTASKLRRRLRLNDLVVVVAGMLVAYAILRSSDREEIVVWRNLCGGPSFGLLTVTWFVYSLILLLADGDWRLAATVPVAQVLAISFPWQVNAIRSGYFRIVSPEHPTFLALDYLLTEVLFVTASLLIIRACGYRLAWKRPSPRRSLKRFVNRTVALVRALGPAPKTIDA